MQAAVTAAASATAWWPVFTDVAVQAWQWGSGATVAAMGKVLAMPGECHSSIVHAVTVCAGIPRQHFFTPGFAPFGVC